MSNDDEDDGRWPERLCEDAPLLFERCCIECGPGWEPLIREAMVRLIEWNINNPQQTGNMAQIKEKFGYLRVYSTVNGYVTFSDLEAKSGHMCEQCGSAELAETRSYNGWMSTLCVRCHDRRNILAAMRDVP